MHARDRQAGGQAAHAAALVPRRAAPRPRLLLLHAAARSSGYDGKKVDVWASGVLLFVMLLGMFPFEMEDESYVNTAGLYSIWCDARTPASQGLPARAALHAAQRLCKLCRRRRCSATPLLGAAVWLRARRIQQIRTSWQEHPHNNNAVMRLSPECRDLLDKMFDVNQVTVCV